jgi:hypothetical protein
MDTRLFSAADAASSFFRDGEVNCDTEVGSDTGRFACGLTRESSELEVCFELARLG